MPSKLRPALDLRGIGFKTEKLNHLTAREPQTQGPVVPITALNHCCPGLGPQLTVFRVSGTHCPEPRQASGRRLPAAGRLPAVASWARPRALGSTGHGHGPG